MDLTLFKLDFSLQDQYLANFIDLAQNTSSIITLFAESFPFTYYKLQIEQHYCAQAGNVGGAYLGPGTTFGVKHSKQWTCYHCPSV